MKHITEFFSPNERSANPLISHNPNNRNEQNDNSNYQINDNYDQTDTMNDALNNSILNPNDEHSMQNIQIEKRATKTKKFNEGTMTRNHIFCKNLIIVNGKTYKCRYHQRTNRFDPNHICYDYIKDKKKDKKIDEFLTDQVPLKYLETSKLSLEDHVALVCAQLNFSIKSVCSPTFHDLLYHFIRAGQDSIKFGTRPNEQKIYTEKDRSCMRKRIIQLSEGTMITQCRIASISSPLSAALDGGTVAHNHFVDVLLNDILYNSGTFLFDTFSFSSFNSKTYLNIGKQIIDKALTYNITISCFVGDRLRSQMKGLNHLNPNSLQNKFYDIPHYSSIVFIPCICHILNRSLIKTIHKNEALKNAVNLLNSLQVLLRKPGFYDVINKYMPSMVETRWVYLFDTGFWAVQNKELINSILSQTQNLKVIKYLKNARFSVFQKGIPSIIEETVTIMMPIKVFFDKIESNKAPLWWIKPLFQELFIHLRSIEGDLKLLSNECRQLIDQMEMDYFEFARTELIDTSYSFTSIGRKLFRTEFFENKIDDECNIYPDEPKLDFSKYLNKLPEEINKFILEHFVDNNSSSSNDEYDNDDIINAGEEEDSEEEEDSGDELDQQTISQESNPDNQQFNHNLTQKTLLNYYLKTLNDEEESQSKATNTTQNDNVKEQNLHHWNNLNIAKEEGMYQCALYCIKEICNCKNYDKDKKRKIIDQYNNYFKLSCELMANGDLLYESNSEFWVAAKYSSSMKEIAEIALYFLSLSATQSTCERNISIKRCAVSKQQYRMKNDILTARARLACLKDNIKLKLK